MPPTALSRTKDHNISSELQSCVTTGMRTVFVKGIAVDAGAIPDQVVPKTSPATAANRRGREVERLPAAKNDFTADVHSLF